MIWLWRGNKSSNFCLTLPTNTLRLPGGHWTINEIHDCHLCLSHTVWRLLELYILCVNKAMLHTYISLCHSTLYNLIASKLHVHTYIYTYCSIVLMHIANDPFIMPQIGCSWVTGRQTPWWLAIKPHGDWPSNPMVTGPHVSWAPLGQTRAPQSYTKQEVINSPHWEWSQYVCIKQALYLTTGISTAFTLQHTGESSATVHQGSLQRARAMGFQLWRPNGRRAIKCEP